jgi:hypothetical protein
MTLLPVAKRRQVATSFNRKSAVWRTSTDENPLYDDDHGAIHLKTDTQRLPTWPPALFCKSSF